MKSKSKKLSSIYDLVEADLIPAKDANVYKRIEASYDIGVSAHVRDIILDSNDPIARQYIPSLEELKIKSDEKSDPIGDDANSPVKGIVHRYPDRALLKITNICDVYCRYCFRRELIGAGSDHLIKGDYDKAIEYIKAHKEIWEVILTGGDPLILSAHKLQKIMDDLGAIEHVRVIRVHTRIPIVNPDKIDNTILTVLKSVSKALYMVLHVNHVQEITEKSESVIEHLRRVNCSVLSQSVLLKGVNDDAETLEGLFKKLIILHIKPYYLHHMDSAKGTSHFRVSLERGQQIMKELQGSLSGICLPKYMLDIPDGYGKVPINDSYVCHVFDNEYIIEDYKGYKHKYND